MVQVLFGEKIKEIRTNQQMSQLELSKAADIERAQISRIEKGKVNITLETIEKLSEALNVDIKDLFTYNNYLVRPFVKWAGGKTQILAKLKELMPKQYNDYYEPFVGGGALLFSLTPNVAYINDTNDELVAAYRSLKNRKQAQLMIDELIKHEQNHSEQYYLEIRAMDRQDDYVSSPDYIKAARLIYLNKACFNGLYRVNSQGYFNVPSGKKEKVNAFDRKSIKEIQRYFMDASINVSSTDFELAVATAKAGDFVYFDPPYDVYPNTLGFVDYSKNGFGKEEQARLAKVFHKLSKKGVLVMLSNHNTPYINELYKGYNIHVIKARRMINSNAKGRGPVEEVIITNY